LHRLSWFEIPRALRSSVVGVQMAEWEMNAEDALNGLFDRAPAMAERSWNPSAVRSFADFQGRANRTAALLRKLLARLPAPPAPPAPPTPSPVPGGKFTPQSGACRDEDGQFGSYLFQRNVNFSTCRDKCLSLALRCDAYDIEGPMPAEGTDPTVPWCGIWGVTLSPEDADASFEHSNGHFSSTRVCQGLPSAGKNNTCYRRPPLCSGASEAAFVL